MTAITAKGKSFQIGVTRESIRVAKNAAEAYDDRVVRVDMSQAEFALVQDIPFQQFDWSSKEPVH